jgi:hypothetical protein
MVSSPFEASSKAMEKLATPKVNHNLCNANHGGGQNRMIITGAEEDTFYRHFVPLSLVIILNVMALQANRRAEFHYSYNKRSLRGLATDRFPTRHFLVTKLVVERKK